jgi:hypothetical protein
MTYLIDDLEAAKAIELLDGWSALRRSRPA